MRVLVACEESQRVTLAFRSFGHEAYSCDLRDCSGGFPEYHIKDDCLNHLGDGWDMLIGFPPCTYFSRMNFLNYYRNGVFNQERYNKALVYVDLFNRLFNAPIHYICLENPVPFKLFTDLLPPYSMRFQPYEFGENYSKLTCLWLKNLPPLMPTLVSSCYKPLITVHNSFSLYHSIDEQSVFRSKTPWGVALAMAKQWGDLPLLCRYHE